MFNIKLTPLLLFCLLIFILLISVLFRNNFPLAESFSPEGVSSALGPRGRDMGGGTIGETIMIMKNGDTMKKAGDKIVVITKPNISSEMILNEDSAEEAIFNFDGMQEPVIKASNRINRGSINVKFKNRPETPNFFVPPDTLEQ
jgi:hypothetical protein